MTHRRQLSDVPDFLHNSPYLPLHNINYEVDTTQHVQPKPTIKQILKSKRFRIYTYLVIFVIILLYLLNHTGYTTGAFEYLAGPSCLSSPPFTPALYYLDQDTDWSRYAYAQYVTNTEYLCNSVMLFETLQKLGSKADRLMLYPSSFSPDGDSVDSRLLRQARDDYGVNLVPIEVQHKNTAYYYGPNWADSYTKLLAFDQIQYERLLVLDSDSTILQHMDELFFVPPCPAAMPRAYWITKPTLTSHVMVIQPSEQQFEHVQTEIKKAGYGVYDMEIINRLFRQDCVILPHRKYALLTGEFRSKDHGPFLKNGDEVWDPQAAFMEAKFVHFSDHPLPKPWEATQEEVDKAKPQCDVDSSGEENCRARDIWLDLYSDFRERRKNICELDVR